MNNPRYSRQTLFPPIGESGQSKLAEAFVVMVGCGALGTVSANHLVRAGIGSLRIIDRDFVEMNNLHRQLLLDEEDARRRMPKAAAAVERLRQINSEVGLEAEIADLNHRNIEKLIDGATLVIDATDNMETRFLLNDACVKAGIPWVYGGAVAAEGIVMPILPGQTACLRCLMPEPPVPGVLPTCDRAGVLNTLTAIVASLQCSAALRMIIEGAPPPWQLLTFDVWEGEFRGLNVSRREDCPACGIRRFEFLEGRAASSATSLCGRDMVQINPPEARRISLESLRDSLKGAGEVSFNGFLLSLKVDGRELIVFPDGRALVKGTSDVSEARGLYAKYVGA